MIGDDEILKELEKRANRAERELAALRAAVELVDNNVGRDDDPHDVLKDVVAEIRILKTKAPKEAG